MKTTQQIFKTKAVWNHDVPRTTWNKFSHAELTVLCMAHGVPVSKTKHHTVSNLITTGNAFKIKVHSVAEIPES